MKPIILITTYHVEKKELKGKYIRGSRGQDLTICTSDYINAVRKAGGAALAAPCTSNDEELDEMLSIADGVLFSGGEDVHPRYYNEDVEVTNMKISDIRDEFEIKLAKRLFDMKIPVLGICRGMQVLNIAAGGTVYQDINHYVDTPVRHSNSGAFKWDIAHQVTVEKNTRLHDIYGVERNAVNSFHHQAVKDLAEGFVISSRADDGIIEGMEMAVDRFFVAVQWHPEMMHEKFDEELEIFKHFVKCAKTYRNSK